MKKTLSVALVAAIAALFIWAFKTARSSEAEEAETIKIPPRVRRAPSGETIVTVDPQAQARIGLKTEALASAALPEEVTAYGSLQEDPAQSFLLRAPVAGTLRHSKDQAWPLLGEGLADGSVVGVLEPRLAPAERVNLAERLVSARADAEATAASLTVARAALARARTLNAEDKNISDRALQEAEARVKAEEARLKAATEAVRLIESALAAGAGSPITLAVERGGQVVEMLAQPDEAVESGQPILRLARFDQLLARVEVPAGQSIQTPVSAARIIAIGHEDRPLRGERVALGAAVDPRTQGQPFLFRVHNPGLNLRPGMAVTAYLRVPGAPRQGVVVPRSALVRFAGATWTYLEIGANEFSRRQIALERSTEKGWFTGSLKPGQRIVVTGAQTLLSEELKSQIQVGEEEAKR
jgi:hypothetical protein